MICKSFLQAFKKTQGVLYRWLVMIQSSNIFVYLDSLDKSCPSDRGFSVSGMSTCFRLH